MPDHLEELGDLLSQVGAQVTVQPSRVAPSTLYDIDYHIAIVACAFASHGRQLDATRTLISPPLLKMLQFITARPSLLPGLKLWLQERGQRSLETLSRMPRGYLGDRTHDRTIEFLLASGVLRFQGKLLSEGRGFRMLTHLEGQLALHGLFQREREVLAELRDLRIPQVALEGR